jgi:hypothetical protein
MRARGFDEDTVEDYRNLHRMREGGKWKTREAMWLHRRRTILTGGDWTGQSAMKPDVPLTDEPFAPLALPYGGEDRDAMNPSGRSGTSVSGATITMQVQRFAPNITINPTLTVNGAKIMAALVGDPTAMGILWEGLQPFAAKKVTVRP